jgi:hypothetical protein
VTAAPPRSGRRALAVIGATVGVLLITTLAGACGNGLLFARDARLRIVAPRDMETVALPVHLRWTSTVAPSGDTRYAVFVDVLPVHPGQNLRAVAGPRCAGVPSCVDEALLNRHSVYLARAPRLDLDALPILGPPKGERDVHHVTIVLVDAGWRRLGESAWSVSFALRHRAGP